MQSNKIKTHAALITANLLFGLNYSYSKSIIPNFLPPMGLAVLRMAFAAALFVVAIQFVRRERIEKGDLLKLFVASILGLVLNQMLFLQGLNYTSPVDASIITTAIPLLVLFISAIFIKERITFLKLVGVVTGAVGALLVILYGGLSRLGEGALQGNLLVLASSISYAGYLVWSKPLMEKYSPLTVMTVIFVMAALVTTPIFGMSLVRVDYGAIPIEIWGAIAFVLIFPTFLAYLCIGYGLKRVPPTTVSIYQYAQPVVASFFAIFRGQDTVDGIKLLAAALVFAGVFLVTQAVRLEAILLGFYPKNLHNPFGSKDAPSEK